MEIRTRVAPSPTGVPHIGFARTALYNWLLAKKEGGKFILRMEDTDRARFVPESVPQILEMLKWLGLTPDEGPVIGGPYAPYSQSERLDLYKKYALELVGKDAAYYCFCSQERLEEVRKKQEKEHKPPMYDRLCRKISKDDAQKKVDLGEKYVIRLKVPDEGTAEWDDLVHGHIKIEYRLVDDQILLKSDGFPTYHLGVVVDDHLMKINPVLRGVEWISSTPKHILIYKALGWEMPPLGHLPLVLGPDKAKLSKRHGAKSALVYRDDGYLPEAILNTIFFWGWGTQGEKEFYTKEEMIEAFSLNGVSKGDPIVHLEKLDWFNGQYIRKLSNDELMKRLEPFIPGDYDRKKIKKILPLVKDRMVTLRDFTSLTDFVFKGLGDYEKSLLIPKEKTLEEVEIALQNLIPALSLDRDDWNSDMLEKRARLLAENIGWKTNDLFMTIRVAVTGKTATPPLFETMEVLGREECLKRLALALEK